MSEKKDLERFTDYAMWLAYAHSVGMTHADRIIGYRPEKPKPGRFEAAVYK